MRPLVRLEREHDRLLDGQVREQQRVLERAAESEASPLAAGERPEMPRPRSSTVPSLSTYPPIAFIRVVLPAPLAPMSPDDLVRGDGDAHPVDRGDASEAHGDVVAPQRRRTRWEHELVLRFGARRRGGSPGARTSGGCADA